MVVEVAAQTLQHPPVPWPRQCDCGWNGCFEVWVEIAATPGSQGQLEIAKLKMVVMMEEVVWEAAQQQWLGN